MTLEAIRELDVQSRLVGLAMAIAAAHGRTVFALMTGHAVEFPVLGLGSRQ